MILQLAYTHALVGATLLKFVHCVLNSCMSHSKDTVVKRIFALPLVIAWCQKWSAQNRKSSEKMIYSERASTQ